MVKAGQPCPRCPQPAQAAVQGTVEANPELPQLEAEAQAELETELQTEPHTELPTEPQMETPLELPMELQTQLQIEPQTVLPEELQMGLPPDMLAKFQAEAPTVLLAEVQTELPIELQLALEIVPGLETNFPVNVDQGEATYVEDEGFWSDVTDKFLEFALHDCFAIASELGANETAWALWSLMECKLE